MPMKSSFISVATIIDTKRGTKRDTSLLCLHYIHNFLYFPTSYGHPKISLTSFMEKYYKEASENIKEMYST